MSADNILKYISYELKVAENKYDDFETYYHGYAVILEELDEMWNEIKNRQPSPVLIAAEAVQVAAMCVRMIKLCQKNKDNPPPTGEKED